MISRRGEKESQERWFCACRGATGARLTPLEGGRDLSRQFGGLRAAELPGFFSGGGTFYRRAAAICSVGGVNRHLWISASRNARVVRGMVNRMARRVAGIYDSSPNAPAKALYCVGLDCWNEGVFPSTAMVIGMEIRDRVIAV